jgi:anaerobic selenocysteine-containing dehydrogenase
LRSAKLTTFCRVCEPACGLIADVRDGQLVGLAPDREHPVTKGFACNKGIAGLAIHRDPDRLSHPLRRGPNGLERITWDEAISEIAARVRAILERHGPGAVSGYIGNPTAFNSLFGPASAGFFGQLGVRRMFNSGTQDCANKFAGSEAVFGSSTVHPIPDIEHTDYLLILGENPRVSHMSFLAIADPMRVLKDAARRGARIRFVNPRRIESARPDVGDVVLIRPDTDVYLLAAMLCEIDRSVGFDPALLREHGAHVEGLRQFVRRYPPERVAPVTGIEADTIRELARDFAAAPSASIHMSTGVNMGRQGTLAYWLLHMLSFVTGNLDRRGGNLLSVGFYPNAKAGRRRYADGFVEGPYGTMRKGALPGNLLAQYIEEADDPIRALFICAGNPLLSIGGEAALRRAFERLELVVSIDLYRNASAEYAHYLLPATDMFERADVNITGLGLQHQPYVQFTERVVEPQFERREEWWIFGRLCQSLGLKSPFDQGDAPNVFDRLDHMLARSELSTGLLREHPRGVILPRPEPGSFYAHHLQSADRKVDCCPPAFAEALERAEQIFVELSSEPRDALKLITKRDSLMHNTWYHNVDKMKRGDRDRNYLFMHPSDAEARGLSDGEQVRISNAHGQVEAPLRISDDLMPGVVAMTHGWGNARTPGMRLAQRTPGVNANALLPTGPGSFDPLSNQAHMTGVPVDVAPL